MLITYLEKGEKDMHYDFDEDRYILDVPTECPKCGSKLELDVNYDNTHLLCPNQDCDYELDVTDEFKELEAAKNEENEEE